MRAHFTNDAAIGALAARQYGIVTRAQLMAAGLTSRAIGHRLSTGRLHRLHSGVYAVGHAAPRREARWLAAVLACDGVLSHRSAATLSTIRDGEGPHPDVTIRTGSGRRHPGIDIHRSHLLPSDCTRYRGIPVTTPTRTLVDLAHELDPDELKRALREAQYQRRFNLKAARELLTRHPSKTLSVLVEDLILVQNGLEDRLINLCDRHGIPRPVTQHPILGHDVDFFWPAARVVVETDGWQAHGTRTAFQSDRTFSNALQLAGYTILRFTDNDLKRHPNQIARQLHTALTPGASLRA